MPKSIENPFPRRDAPKEPDVVPVVACRNTPLPHCLSSSSSLCYSTRAPGAGPAIHGATLLRALFVILFQVLSFFGVVIQAASPRPPRPDEAAGGGGIASSLLDLGALLPRKSMQQTPKSNRSLRP